VTPDHTIIHVATQQLNGVMIWQRVLERVGNTSNVHCNQWCGPRPSVLGQDRFCNQKHRSWSWYCRSGVV